MITGWFKTIINGRPMMARVCWDGMEMRDLHWYERILDILYLL